MQHIDDVEITSIVDLKRKIDGFQMFYDQYPVMYLRDTERSNRFIDVDTGKCFEFGYSQIKIEKVGNKFITVSYWCDYESKTITQKIGILSREDYIKSLNNYLVEGFHITVRFFRED